MDALNDPLVETVVCIKSAQVGWTEILGNVAGYFIDQDPSPILMVQPTVDMGKAWSKDRFSHMLKDTDCLKNKVRDSKSRDSGNTVLHKEFDGGHITIAGANSAAGLASRPIRILLGDEISPDTCRFWEKGTKRKLDKDRFRRDLGGIEEAYQEMLSRIESGAHADVSR